MGPNAEKSSSMIPVLLRALDFKNHTKKPILNTKSTNLMVPAAEVDAWIIQMHGTVTVPLAFKMEFVWMSRPFSD